MVNVRQLIAELTLLFGLEPFVTVAHKFGMGDVRRWCDNLETADKS